MQQLSCQRAPGRERRPVIAERLRERLAALGGPEAPARYLVAFSGGLDSTVLLHALASTRGRHDTPLVAVHVNHGLQSAAERWEAHCRRVARELGVEFLARRIDVPVGDPRGTEAAARAARYAALAALVLPGDHVLTAHHQDDQAETLLLNLLRGSGAPGLAGIGARQRFAAGLLLRPLLDVPRAALEAYAARHALAWCDDPSNADSAFDRNFLRREIVPALRRRWPAATASLARSAALLAETAELLSDLAAQDLARAGGDPARLALGALCHLSEARQRNLLRYAIRRLGLPAAPAKRLAQVAREVLPAGAGAEPLVRWEGGEVRRYRDHLYLLARGAHAPPAGETRLFPGAPDVALGPGLGRIRLVQSSGGIDAALAAGGLRVAFRAGGERLRPAGRRGTHELRKLFQEIGVVPWMRAKVPLLYAGERLVAIADLWVAHDAWSAQGYAVEWLERPALH